MTSNRIFMLGVSALALSIANAASGQDRVVCDGGPAQLPEGCIRANGGLAVTMPIGANAEEATAPMGADFDAVGFSISIDGETVAGAKAPRLPSREADLAASDAGINIRFDGLDQSRLLNVTTADLRAAYRAGEVVTFRASSNYPAFVARAEIRLLQGGRVVETRSIAPNGTVDWQMPADGTGVYDYVLRVYDAAGRWDETRPLPLRRIERDRADPDLTGPVIAAGEGEDRTRVRNIPVAGGLVTVSGRGARTGGSVRVMGETVPVDPSGRFVVSRLLPVGTHSVTVEDGGRKVQRVVTIPASDWFRVGIVDLTFGKRFKDDQASSDPDYSDTYVDGRVAVYATGQTATGWKITGSVDSGDGPIEDIFRRLNEKDPRAVIRRLDENDGYLTYGDDSTARDDAPTSGRVYLRVEREGTRFTWGDFKGDLGDRGLLAASRSLYGAELRHSSAAVTDEGAPRLQARLYAAQPETLPQRDILRGTGGSVYFLSRQDIDAGSETISVQVVDPDTGRVISTRRLVAGTDYQIDYVQGVVTLSQPLSSATAGGGIVGAGTDTNDVNLIAQYEYTPTTGDIDGSSLGGRLEFRPTDRLTLGVTAFREKAGLADQTGFGADLGFDIGENSHLEAEIARTDGPGFGQSVTTDGGLTITPGGGLGGSGTAWRLGGDLDLRDLGSARDGRLRFWAEHRQAGFSTLTEDITADRTVAGASLDLALNDTWDMGAEAERFAEDGGTRETEAEVRLRRKLGEGASLSMAVGHLDRTEPGDPAETGSRTDFALRYDRRVSDDLSWFLFGQATLQRSGGLDRDDRIGGGVESQLSQNLRASVELSDGTAGVAARARLGYSPSAGNEVYLGYTLDPTRTAAGTALSGRDDGTIVLGARYRHDERYATYFENSWDMFGARHSITEAYGVTYTPNSRWTFSGSVELGKVRDDVSGDFDRSAWSVGTAYDSGEGVTGRLRLEYRTEDGVGTTQDRDTWAVLAGYEYKVNDDWTFMAGLDALVSDSDQSAYRDGEYVEARLGYAWRPVTNDRMNVLFGYRYLRDLPGEDQVTADGSTDGPLQISHVLSVDASYDLSPRLTIGGKYGVRLGRTAPRGTTRFTDSTAHLGIVRLDWHVVHEWDLMGELRALRTVETETTETGALLGVYRHVGNNAKIGIGYEWGRVSDDLTDIDYDGQGVFVNLVAKF